jgi:hypothetical protein
VSLTPRGRAVVDEALHARFMAAETSVNGLDADERVLVEAGLRKLLLSLKPPRGSAGESPIQMQPAVSR